MGEMNNSPGKRKFLPGKRFFREKSYKNRRSRRICLPGGVRVDYPNQSNASLMIRSARTKSMIFRMKVAPRFIASQEPR